MSATLMTFEFEGFPKLVKLIDYEACYAELDHTRSSLNDVRPLWHERSSTVRLQEIRIRDLEAAAEKVHGIIAEYWGPCMGSVECLLTLREAVGERAKAWGPKVSDLPRVTELETKVDQPTKET